MSKGLLLDYLPDENIKAPIPEGKIWLYANTDSGEPQIKGKLATGKEIVFGPIINNHTIRTVYYQCVSVDTTSGTWSGYEWRIEGGGYTIGNLNENMKYSGFVPEIGVSYSGDTKIMCGNIFTSEPVGDVESITFTKYACPINPTSADSGDWVLSVDSMQNDNGPWRAFDDSNMSSYWHSYGNDSISIIHPAWIQWQNTKERVLIKKYSITTTEYDFILPKSWELQGSDDGINWRTLDSVSKPGLVTTQETLCRSIMNITPYYYHRLCFTATQSNGYVAIALIRAGE